MAFLVGLKIGLIVREVSQGLQHYLQFSFKLELQV